jgi:hypothetical protein
VLRAVCNIFFLTSLCGKINIQYKSVVDRAGRRPLISPDRPPAATRAEILAALERAGWEIDDVQPRHIVASDGERYGIAVFFENGVPAALEYGDGEEELQCSEIWNEAPGILAPAEVARLFSDEEGAQG